MTISADAGEVSPDDRYLLEQGRVFMNGTQVLVRVILDQMRADRAAGFDTGAMVSGYPGSPLGGFDQELARSRAFAEPLDVVHRPGQNEELGATAVWGSQLVPTLPDPRKAGVLGVWYGKAPGVDRAADAFRHGNFVGAHPLGGLIAFCGDDPTCKSSTLPSATESSLAALGMPVIHPGSVQELLDLGRHAIAASRASGLWVAVKAVSNVVDATGTVDVGHGRITPVMPVVEHQGRPYRHVPDGTLLTPWSLEMERTLTGPRLELARAYARENELNRITADPRDAWLGIVASGTAYYDVREGLRRLGVTPEELGIRLLKIGMLWPLDPEIVRTFARGLTEILVVEEKGPLLETLVKDVLYGTADAPRVLGKLDENDAPLIPRHGAVDADLAAKAVAFRLRRRGIGERVEKGLATVSRPAPLKLITASRTPFFCSGCPHNRSTAVPDGAVVGAGIGCHTMVVLNREGKGTLAGLTQMGGEGAQWIGQAPFTGTPHIFQNLGDGTFHHSGSLAVRAAVGAGVNITYKILYNSAVAMTGGQTITPALSVADLTRWLETEGVRRVIVTTDEPERYRGVALAPIAEVRDRSALQDAQRELAATPGVTVLVHDQQCAAEKRRLRKKGTLPDPVRRVAINQRVCEGCGDCARKSECLSVLPVETEFGRKTEIHQSSCNKDYSCVDGDCPSFVTVVPAGKGTAGKRPPVPAPPRMPVPGLPTGETSIRLVGIGGTGVVSVAQILGTAAMLDGKRSRGLDQTGLAQKGGTVVSDILIFEGDGDRTTPSGAAGVDAYLALDLIGATDPKHLAAADRDRTVAVVSTSLVPTGSMVLDPATHLTDPASPVGALEARTRRELNVYLDAERVAQALFGDHMPANTIVVGAAWQRGLIPIRLESIERAIRAGGGRAAERTIAAFHWGRAVVSDPEAVARATRPAVPVPPPVAREAARLVDALAEPGTELHRILSARVPDLAAYQNPRYAVRYAHAVRAVLDREREALGAEGWEPAGSFPVTEAYARQLHRLMAYKDEYEVARLHLDPAERARIAAEFGPGARISYNLHPPALRALGMKRKLRLGPWFDPAFHLLYGMRGLRGTRLDPFGLGRVRRTERELAEEYTRDLHRALAFLDRGTAERVRELAELPDVVRGYEDVKLRGVAAYRERAAELLGDLRRG
ncbi:indolepyruvate ferredoxin oxidoreductase [Streptosporangium becharense]|uniref:Indolepyruvate ferredoxin oxidoreductase n=1 Tax=Streptosporangium becharense TaxID=1816182 RepID=A0A7W9MJU3_9ACTN|nr:indolepyruvate ferredoxin oxidoreductase family protein [Streptosporangium becharense]MBB2910170.1 indolepyruvate ferredoxin oxidoreductase [Streptosporangium becharense]MBB5822913.1 indolepyruvate ferredoxin oxidoreductase [Streptosporangium becharense]